MGHYENVGMDRMQKFEIKCFCGQHMNTNERCKKIISDIPETWYMPNFGRATRGSRMQAGAAKKNVEQTKPNEWRENNLELTLLGIGNDGE